jgi:hypothetical protein
MTMTTIESIKREYELLRVGQAIYAAVLPRGGQPGIPSARVSGVGRKWIYLAGGRRCQGDDVLDWWKG